MKRSTMRCLVAVVCLVLVGACTEQERARRLGTFGREAAA